MTSRQDGIQTPSVYPECAELQEKGKEEILGTADRLQYVPSSSRFATHTGENEEPVITSMNLIFLHSLHR